MDSTMIPMRIKELETKKNTLPSFEWIKDKLEDIGNSNVLKSKKNIPKLKKQKEVQNLKKEIATAKKYFESLKKKKWVDKRSIKTLGNKIKNLEEKIMKH